MTTIEGARLTEIDHDARELAINVEPMSKLKVQVSEDTHTHTMSHPLTNLATINSTDLWTDHADHTQKNEVR